MSQQDELNQLDAAIAAVNQAATDEKTQVAAAIDALNARVAELEAAVPPEVDLSAQIQAVTAAANNIAGIYTPPEPPVSGGGDTPPVGGGDTPPVGGGTPPA